MNNMEIDKIAGYLFLKRLCRLTLGRRCRRVERRGIQTDTPCGLVAESERTFFQELIGGTYRGNGGTWRFRAGNRGTLLSGRGSIRLRDLFLMKIIGHVKYNY